MQRIAVRMLQMMMMEETDRQYNTPYIIIWTNGELTLNSTLYTKWFTKTKHTGSRVQYTNAKKLISEYKN